MLQKRKLFGAISVQLAICIGAIGVSQTSAVTQTPAVVATETATEAVAAQFIADVDRDVFHKTEEIPALVSVEEVDQTFVGASAPNVNVDSILNAASEDTGTEDVTEVVDVPVNEVADFSEEDFALPERREVADLYVGNDGFTPSKKIPLDEKLQHYIHSLCEANEIDETLVLAVIKHESDFDADLISSTDDYGLMQINKCNHGWLSDELGVTDFLDPVDNVRCGVYILKNLLDRYGDTEKALMAYNMGGGGANKLWKQGITSSRYSSGVLKDQKTIKKWLKES